MVPTATRPAEDFNSCTHKLRSFPRHGELERHGNSIHVKSGKMTNVPLPFQPSSRKHHLPRKPVRKPLLFPFSQTREVTAPTVYVA